MGQVDQLTAVTRAVARGEETAEAAKMLREDVRWTIVRDNPERQARIRAMIEEIREAMIAIRTEIGRLMYSPIPDEQERALRDVSGRLQYERKQLKKMR